jgi:signal transduction histidine kinase
LRHRDVAIGAILEGFAILGKTTSCLERVEFLRPAETKKLIKTLKEAAQRLNTDGYEAVRTLLDRLRLLQVDSTMLESIHQRICREPKLAGLRIPQPQVEVDSTGPVLILVPLSAFEDVLGNLIRNAIVSTCEAGQDAPLIGLGIATEVDSITGFESVLFAVRDRSPQPLTTEMIRGRYIEGGLGISSDLVARHEGSIDVEMGPGNWAKSVIVRFPLATAEGENI